MRIAHVLAWVSRNGGGVYSCVSDLSKAQKDLGGIDVEAFGSWDKYVDEDIHQWKPLKVNTARVVGPKRLCYTPYLQNMLEEFKPDIIHTAGMWTWQASMVNNLYASNKIPFILSTHGTLKRYALSCSRWKKGIALRMYANKHIKQAACIHATALEETIDIRNFGCKNPIAIIPIGINMANYLTKCDSSIKNSIWPQIHDKKIMLFMSRIHPIKGLLNLAKAWGELAKRYKDWHLVIAGPDECGHETEVKQAIEHAGVTELTSFVGPLYGERKKQILSACDVFVIPSFSENFGIVIAEALASNKPVITTKATPWRELITYDCGWYIDIGVEPLIAAMKEAMDASDEKRNQMGTRGRRLIEQNYSWPRIASQIIDVYKWAMNGGVTPSCIHFL